MGLSLGAIVGLVGCGKELADGSGPDQLQDKRAQRRDQRARPRSTGCPPSTGSPRSTASSPNGLSRGQRSRRRNGLAVGQRPHDVGAGARPSPTWRSARSPPDDSLVKADQNGARYTFPGSLGLAPQWKNGACDTNCQEIISACMMAHVNTTGRHINLYLDSPVALGLGRQNAYPMQEGAFFGNIFASARRRPTTATASTSIARPVAGRIGVEPERQPLHQPVRRLLERLQHRRLQQRGLRLLHRLEQRHHHLPRLRPDGALHHLQPVERHVPRRQGQQHRRRRRHRPLAGERRHEPEVGLRARQQQQPRRATTASAPRPATSTSTSSAARPLPAASSTRRPTPAAPTRCGTWSRSSPAPTSSRTRTAVRAQHRRHPPGRADRPERERRLRRHPDVEAQAGRRDATANSGTTGSTGSSSGSPCASYCSTSTPISTQSFGVSNLGTAAVCYSTTFPIAAMNCGNMSGRTMSVNGTVVDCNNPVLPAKVNGGYCFQASAGGYSYAYMGMW